MAGGGKKGLDAVVHAVCEGLQVVRHGIAGNPVGIAQAMFQFRPDLEELPLEGTEAFQRGGCLLLPCWLGYGGQGGLWPPGGLPLCPVVPEGVVALVLVEADTVAEFGAYLVGVDAGEEGGELADGHTEGVLVP